MSIKFLENLCLSKTYFENSKQEYNEEFNEDYIETEDCEYLSNDYLDMCSFNYQVPVINKNKLHILNYINRLGLILTKEGLYKKENYDSKYSLVDFLDKEQNIKEETDDMNKINIEKIKKIKNFFSLKKKNKNLINKKVKENNDNKENTEDKNVWFKEPTKLNKVNNKNINFDKNFPPLIKDEVIINKTVILPENKKHIDNDDDSDDDDSDDDYNLKKLIQKTNYNNEKQMKKPIEKPIDNFKNKNDKNNGWIKVETNKEIKNIRERNNAYDILSDKDKLKTKLKRTKLCLSIINKTICPHKENCRYAHKFEELEQCLFSDNCRFIKKDKGTYVNISKTKICEYKHKNETASNYFNRISVNSPNKNDKNLNIKKL